MELITAAKNGDFNTVFNLLLLGHRANVRDHDNATPLYWSACHGHNSLCEVLIEGGSDVNARVKWGSTPLHAASDRGHTECVKILIENGADVNCQNNRGDTPLHIAAYRGNNAITRQLIHANSDTALKNDKGKTPQEEAMEGGHREIADCIDRFVSGSTQAISHRQNGSVHPITQSNGRIRNAIHNAPPTATDRLNGIYNPAIFSGLGPGNTSSLTESACSSSDVTSGTGSYDFTDSSVFSSVPESSQLKGFQSNLKRSVSVGGHDTVRPLHHVTRHPTNPMAAKTTSMCNIPYTGFQNNNVYENDINKTYSSVDSVCVETSKLNMINEQETTNLPRVMASSYSPDLSTKLTSNGRCVATESVDGAQLRLLEEDQMLRHHVPEMRSQNAAFNRPLRASTGSVKDMTNVSENQNSFLKTLQIQLVNAYKEIEKLTTERDDLKFKCSTVINRLTDTEQALEEKTKECEMLKELVDASRKESAQVNTGGTTANVHFNDSWDVCTDGFSKLSERLTNDLPDITQLQKTMQENLLALSQRTPGADFPEAANREWVPGVDYVIIGENQATWLEPKPAGRVPLSISFCIKHLRSGERFVLKMLLMLENLQATHWTFEQVLLKTVSANPDCLWRHPNVAKTVHQFEGATERFKKFVGAPVSKSVQLCGRTLFIVTNETKTFRTLLESINRNGDSDVYGSFIEFIVQVMYQVLSFISYLEGICAIHGNLTEDTIVMDKALRPLLSDIEAAVCRRSSLRLPASQLSEQLTTVGYGTCQALDKGQCSNDLRSVCEMFHRILTPNNTALYLSVCNTDFKQKLTSVQEVLNTVTSPSIAATHSSKMLLQRVGCILYGPGKNSVQSQKDCSEFLLTQILKMTAEVSDMRFHSQCSDYISVQESVSLRRPELKAHFLCSITAEELWDVYQCCDRESWLVSWRTV